MKKLGFVIPWFGEKIPGGAEMELRGLTAHMAAAGIELEILATCVKEFTADWNVNHYKEGLTEVQGIPVRRFPVRKRDTAAFDTVNYKLMNRIPLTAEEEETYVREMVNSPALYQYMKEHQDEYQVFVFIPYMFGTTYYGSQICPEKSVLIPCLHDESYAYMNVFKEAYSRVAGMIFHAQPESDLAHQIYDLSSVDARVLGEGIDTDLTGDAERFRQKYHIAEPFVLYAGRKDAGKNVHTLIRYFAEYKKRNPQPLKLILIGGGEIEIPKEAKEDILDLGFLPIQDKYDAYTAALTLCQPSLNESFSLVVMESWLARRPVLVHGKCAVTRHFATVSGGGLYFEDYFEWEGCMNYYLAHPDTVDQMGRNGREFAVNNFAWDVIVEKYRNYFEQLGK